MKEELFRELPAEVQEQYAREAEKLYDPEVVRASNAKWNARTKDERKVIIDEGNQIYADFAKAIGSDPSSQEVQKLVERWKAHIGHFWKPDLDGLLGLADLYNDDPRFRVNIGKIHPKLPEFIRKAVRIYVMSRR